MTRHSGIQLQVLALYRQFIRTARKKQPELQAVIRAEFHKQQPSISATEYAIRQGQRQLQMMKSSGFKQVQWKVET